MNNIEEIKCYIARKQTIIVCLSETHVTEEITEAELKIISYKIKKCCIGILMFIKNNINYENVKRQTVENFIWIISLKIRFNTEKYLISALYHSPDKNEAKFLSFMNNFIHSNVDFMGTL